MAAASLIIQEAKAKITTPEGKPIDVKLDPKQKVSFVAAGNPHFHKVILDLIEPEKEKQ
jgi:fructose-1,6-bisphosphatase/inositol monophosphatase family enzyme